jgi:type I restriction enzyme S subunit
VRDSSSWPVLPLGDLLMGIQPGFASGRHNTEGTGLPHLRPMNVSTEGHIDRSIVKYIDPTLADHAARRLRKGDVLFNNTNSPELVGKTALFNDDDEPAFSNHMTRLRVDQGRLEPAYLALRLHQAWREGWFAARCNNHVSQASIGREVLKSFEVELPPLAVQQAIASLADSVEDSRSLASAHLVAASRAIERFRQAVLASACTGNLTTDWRADHPVATVTPPSLNGKRRRGNEAATLDLELPRLPGTYAVSTIGTTAELLEYGTSRKAGNDASGVPMLRMGNIQDGKLDTTDLKYCTPDHEIKRLMLRRGDLLFNRTNSPELVGKAAVFHETTPMTFASYLIRVRFAENVADPDFVSYWINSAWGRVWARHVKTDGVSQSNINGSKLALMPLPLPPFEEQRVIVERASQMLSAADRIAESIGKAEKQVERSSQAVLAKAFRGELIDNGDQR